MFLRPSQARPLLRTNDLLGVIEDYISIVSTKKSAQQTNAAFMWHLVGTSECPP